MRFVKYAYLLAGIVLLGAILWHADLAEAWLRIRQIGWGLAILLAIYFVAFVADTAAWHLTLPSVALDARGLYRLWKVRMVGEAFNGITPFANLGGEPVKAVLLNKRYRLGYREIVASLVLSRTIFMMALVLFLAVGFVLMMTHGAFPSSYRLLAGVGLAALAAGILGLYLLQRLKLSSLTGGWLATRRFGRRIEKALHHVRDIDDRFVAFYTRHRRRFAGAFVLAFVNWALGAVDLYYATQFLGRPITFAEAWTIEAITQLVRAGTFLIPANIGAQEGAFVLLLGTITGSSGLGLAVAALRRVREIVWILAGLALGMGYSWRAARLASLAAGKLKRPD